MNSSEHASKWGGHFETIVVSRMFPDVAIETLRIINGVFICIAWVDRSPLKLAVLLPLFTMASITTPVSRTWTR
jgi:hypothetical protein